MSVPVSYNRMSGLALRLLKRYGATIDLVRQESSGPPYQPVIVNVDYPSLYLSVGFADEPDQDLITGTSVKGLLKSDSVTPLVTDRLRINGQLLSITRLEAYRPAVDGPVIAWEVVADV